MTTKKRILVIGLNYAPDLIGIAKYTSELCEDLVRRGHEVEVITAPPYYPLWLVPDDYRGGKKRREVLNGVQLSRAPIYVPSKPTGLTRLVHLASFGLLGLPATIARARSFRPVLILCIAPAIFSAPMALLAAKVARAKTWLHIQDFELDAAFELGLMKGGSVRGFGQALERALFGAFDRVSTISPKMVERLAAKGVNPANALEIRNWVDLDEIPFQPSSDTAFRRKLGIGPDRTVMLYSGNMAAKQGLEIIGSAARILAERQPGAHFLLCGNGPARQGLETSCAGLHNVSFLDLQPAARLPELLASADIHLLPQRPEAADLVLPSKLAPMMASGRPIVATAAPGTTLAGELSETGIVAAPGDTASFVGAIERLLNDPALRARLGAQGRIRAQDHWSRQGMIDRVEAEVERLC